MKVDWLEGTILDVPIRPTLYSVEKLLGDFQELPRGMLGYGHSAIVAGVGRVCWDDLRTDMGVHVILPSSALACIGGDPFLLQCELYDQYAIKLTRIDHAGDDQIGTLNLDVIEESFRKVDYVSRWRKTRREESFECGESQGRTFYFGAPSSDAQIRIYDKAAERRAAGQSYDGDWVRVEIQYRKDRAREVGEYVCTHRDTWQEWAAGLILGYLDFKVHSADSHKCRWPTEPWWNEFLGYKSKERLTFPREIRTIEQVKQWFDRQLVPSLCAMQLVMGRDEVGQLIANGAPRLKSRHLAMIDTALKYRDEVEGEAVEGV